MAYDYLTDEEVDDEELEYRNQLRESVVSGELEGDFDDEGSWSFKLGASVGKKDSSFDERKRVIGKRALGAIGAVAEGVKDIAEGAHYNVIKAPGEFLEKEATLGFTEKSPEEVEKLERKVLAKRQAIEDADPKNPPKDRPDPNYIAPVEIGRAHV